MTKHAQGGAETPPGFDDAFLELARALPGKKRILKKRSEPAPEPIYVPVKVRQVA